MQLQIETINVCNADCVFCPYSKMTRDKGTMDLGLFRKIVDEAVTIPQITHVTLTGLGEPLLDRFLVERVRYVRAALPEAMIDIYTNGSYLRPAMTDALIDAGLSILNVSLCAANADKRVAVMHLSDFDTVVGYIQYAIQAAQVSGSMEVLVTGVQAKDLMEGSEADAFLAMWGGSHTKGGHAFLHLEGNWAGATWPMRVHMSEPCHRALNIIKVLQDGRMILCSFDAEGAMTYGNLHTQTMREIFNGPVATSVRLAHYEGRRAELPLCHNCTSC